MSSIIDARRFTKQMHLKIFFITITTLCTTFFTDVAHADFRKALKAYQAKDNVTMLKEVKDAVDKKNDDGIILFLGILKQYPKTWRPTLNESQTSELFDCLEKATIKSSLQAEYQLAVIPRNEYISLPINPESIKETQYEIDRLEPIANKGYAPAALHLYGSYIDLYNRVINKQATSVDGGKAYVESAKKWLLKAAELGNAQAMFMVGMRYLNVEDDAYGCYSYEPLYCFAKDEKKGWYWMQQAAMRAEEHNITMWDFAYHMGNLYLQGIMGNKPDYQQAYLWYQQTSNGIGYDMPSIWPKLEELKKLGQLKLLNPELDKAWGDAPSWQDAMKIEKAVLAKDQKSNKLPRLMQQKTLKNNLPLPIFTMSTIRWYLPHLNHGSYRVNIYKDGRTNLLITRDALNGMENNELWLKTEPAIVKAFVGDLQTLNFESKYWQPPCESGCVERLDSIVTLNTKYGRKIKVLKNTAFKSDPKLSNTDLIKLYKVVEKYFPLFQLQCDLDVGEGKSICLKIYQDVISAKNKDINND